MRAWMLTTLLVAAAMACGDGEGAEESPEDAAGRMVASYNDYVRTFAIPIAEIADACLSTTFGSVSDGTCSQWVAWTEQHEGTLTATIRSFETSVREERVDKWRRAELATLQLYAEAFGIMTRASEAQDKNLWIEGVTRFRAGQEAGRRADEILTELRTQE